MERIQNCLICNITVGVSARNCVNIFEDKNSLQGDKKLPELIGEIVGKTISESSIVSHIICKKCQRACIEYDGIKRRLEVISAEIKDNFNKTSQLHTNNDNVNTLVKKETKRIVLSKSKLQPLPANYIIDVEKLAAVSKSNIILNSVSAANSNFVIGVDKYGGSKTNDADDMASLFKIPTSMPKTSVNLVATIGTTVLTQTLKSTTSESDPLEVTASDISLIMSPAKTTDTKTVSTSLQTNSTKYPQLSFNIDSLPKDFLATSDKSETKKENDDNSSDDNDTENNDDHPMEIDEDCSLAVVPVRTDEEGKLVFDVDANKSKSNNFLDLNLLLSPDNQDQTNDADSKYILDKLQILKDNDDDDDDDEQTIVMKNSEGTTIIRMAAGQKVVYDGENFSFVPDAQPDNDSQDSNDESQIELQVSGDEETANAIIAAAQEQGGAFIKVESGEMFRVKSVQSKVDDEESLMHIQSIVEVENGQYKCQLCSKNSHIQPFAGDADSIMQHLKMVHNARVYICQICGHVMRKRTEYTTHIEEHSEKTRSVMNKSRVHTCAVCKRRYNSRTLLAAHLNTHTGARPYACADCHKGFASKYTLQAHEKTHLDRPRPFKCDMCGKAFLTLQNLTQHEKTHSNVKEFVCKICDKAFSTQHNLEVHGVIHTGRKPFFCSVCNKAFARRAEVKDHMRIHTGERPFACDICGATFTQRSNLLSHKRSTHMDDRRYHCQSCPKKFKRRRLLDYHIKSAHTGERPLKCEVCRATFVYPEHYKKHLKIHSGEKPFACEVCGKTFNSRDNRNTHRFVHSDKKPYECLSCGAGYMRKQLLYAHMNSTGHVAESIVVNQPRVIKATENGILTPLVDVNGLEIKTDKLSNAIFETTEELELDENDIHSVETTIQGLVQGGQEATFYTLDNLEGIIDGSADDGKLVDSRQILTTDAKGDTMRLIQVQLPDGKTGWVAIDH
ncbi:hypothetical protein ABMA27_010124 [Loxostege sticticalis]|uniref:C2H2-type domain-containing protein n=1 Tax=Loxostege sticticalis TaxID=481309 RepID=A0ABR3H4R8_LOXSC